METRKLTRVMELPIESRITFQAMLQEQSALQREQEGSGSLAVSDGPSSPGPDVANYNPGNKQDHAPNHHQSLDGEFGYDPLNQYPAPAEGDAEADPLVRDQHSQQPADFMAFFNFDRYFNRNQPIAGHARGNDGSHPA